MSAFIKKLQAKKESAPVAIASQDQTIACPIFMFDLNREGLSAPEIVNYCYKYKTDQYKEKKTQAVYAWRSEYIPNTQKKYMPEFDNLFSLAESKVNSISNPNYGYSVDHFWFAIYNKGDSSKVHNHGTVDYASVYYALYPENSAPLVISNNTGDITITPKQGSLIVFPGNCFHSVPQSNHDGERIIVAMNFIKGKFVGDVDFT